MKSLCKAALLVFLFASFANSEEQEQEQESQPPALVSEPVPMPEPAPMPEPVSSDLPLPKKCGVFSPEYYQKNLRVVAYLHPMSLFYGAAYNMLMFTATIEKPLSLSNSVIIQPVAWFGSSDGYIYDIVKYEKIKRAGGGIGMRRYMLDKGYGFYLQTVASAYYISADSIFYKKDNWEDDGWEDRYSPSIKYWTKVKGLVGELVFYAGAAHKWQNINLFYEGGLGFGYDWTHSFQMGYLNRLVFNFNVGVGLPF